MNNARVATFATDAWEAIEQATLANEYAPAALLTGTRRVDCAERLSPRGKAKNYQCILRLRYRNTLNQTAPAAVAAHQSL